MGSNYFCPEVIFLASGAHKGAISRSQDVSAILIKEDIFPEDVVMKSGWLLRFVGRGVNRFFLA